MAIRVNQQAVGHAENLIKGRQYERNSDWSEAQPSAQEENRFIDENGSEGFAKWFLAFDTEASEETKSRYRFPFGDFRKLHRSALIAAKQRAGSEDYNEVQRAADSCLISCLARTTSRRLQRGQPARRLTEKPLRQAKECEGNYQQRGKDDDG